MTAAFPDRRQELLPLLPSCLNLPQKDRGPEGRSRCGDTTRCPESLKKRVHGKDKDAGPVLFYSEQVECSAARAVPRMKQPCRRGGGKAGTRCGPPTLPGGLLCCPRPLPVSPRTAALASSSAWSQLQGPQLEDACLTGAESGFSFSFAPGSSVTGVFHLASVPRFIVVWESGPRPRVPLSIHVAQAAEGGTKFIPKGQLPFSSRTTMPWISARGSCPFPPFYAQEKWVSL